MRNLYLTIKVSLEERKKIQAAANEKGMTTSAYIRWKLLYEKKD